MKPLFNANVNGNLKMNAYSGVFDRMPSEEANAYKEARKLIEGMLGDNGANEALDEFYFKSYDVGDSSFNMGALDDTLTKVNQVIDNKGTIYSLDIETLGDPFEAKGNKNMFSITEVALTAKDIASGKKTIVSNVAIGISEQQASLYHSLSQKTIKGYDTLTDTERSTLERLSRYGSKDTVIADGVVKHLGQSNIYDPDSVTRGIIKLREFGKTNGVGSSIVSNELSNLHGTINRISKMTDSEVASALIAHKGAQFDKPRLNLLFQSAGLSPIDNNLVFLDTLEAIRGTYGGKFADVLLSERGRNNVNTPLLGRIETVEKIAESFGVPYGKHVATGDTMSLLDILTYNLNGNTPFSKAMLSELQSKKTGQFLNSINSNSLVFVRNSVRTKGLDFVMTPEGLKGYGDYPLHRNNFYNVVGVGRIKANQPIGGPAYEAAVKSGIDMNEGFYYMALKNAHNDPNINKLYPGLSGETSYIFRQSLKDLQLEFQRNLDIFNKVSGVGDINTAILNKQVTQEIINQNTAKYLTDLSRRNFEGMFQTSSKGFKYARTMYNTLEEVYNLAGARGINSIDDVVNIIDSNANNSVFGDLKYQGRYISERRADFINMFELLRDSSKTMNSVMNIIQSNIPGSSPEDAVDRTVALGRFYNELEHELSLAKSIIDNKGPITPYATDVDVITLALDNDVKLNIRGKTKEDIRFSILNHVRSLSGANASTKARDAKDMFYIKKMAEKVYGQDLINLNVQMKEAKQELAGLKGKEARSVRAKIKRLEESISTEQTKFNTKIGTMFSEFNKPNIVANKLAEDISEMFRQGKRFGQAEEEMTTILSRGAKANNVALDSVLESIATGKGSTFSGLLGELANRSTQPISSVGSLYAGNVETINGMMTTTDTMFNEVLRSQYGYSEQNMHDLLRMLYGRGNKEYGLVNEKGMSAHFFSDNDRLFMALTDEAGATKAYEDIMKGTRPTNAIISELPRGIDLGHGVKGVGIGNVINQNTSALDVYLEQGGSNPTDRLRMTYRDTLSEALSGGTKVKDIIAANLAKKEYAAGSQILSNAISAPVFDGSGFSGNTTFKDGKHLILNMSDIYMSKSFDTKGLLNMLPMIYESNPDIQQELSKLQTFYYKDYKAYNYIDQEYMRRWTDDILKKSFRDYKQIGPELQDWVQRNMFDGYNLLQKSIELKAKNAERNARDLQILRQIQAAGPSFIGKEEAVAKGIAFLGSPHEYTTYGHLNSLDRPLARQGLAFHALDTETLLNQKATLDKLDIGIGHSVMTEKFYKDFVASTTGASKEAGIMGNVLNINSEDVVKRIEGAYGKTDAIRKALLDRGIDLKDKEITNALDRWLTVGDTSYHHGLVNPYIANNIFNEPTLQSIRLDRNAKFTMAEGLKLGSTVRENQLVGQYDRYGMKVNVYHRGIDGVISEMKDNKIMLKPINPMVDELKLIMQGTEKGVFSSIRGEGAKSIALMQEIWNTVFGMKTAAVSFFEVAKHESLSIAYGSYIDAMANRAAKSKNNTVIFKSMMDTHLPSWGVDLGNGVKGLRVIEDTRIGTRFAINSNPAGKGGHIGAIYNFMNAMANHDAFKDIAQDFLNKDEATKSNTYRTLISRGQFNEFYSSMSDDFDIGGKGLKVTQRMTQVAGMREEDDFYRINAKGERERKLQPVLDLWEDELKRTAVGWGDETNYAKGKSDIKNIVSVLDELSGRGGAQNVYSMSFEELAPKLSGVQGANVSEMLRHSMYQDGADVIKIKLPDGFQIKNSMTGKYVNEILVPHLNSYKIGDIVSTHKAHRSMADLLRGITDVTEGRYPKGVTDIRDVQGYLDRLYAEAISSYGYELGGAKDSIMSKHITSGRLTHSAQSLIGTIYSPEIFASDNITHRLFKDAGVVDIVNGQKVYKDIMFGSPELLESMGVNFEEIGRQTIEDTHIRSQIGDMSDFATRAGMSNTNVDSIFGKEKIDVDALRKAKDKVKLKQLRKLGLQYMEEKGVMGVTARYPTFQPTSVLAVNIRADRRLEGFKFNLQSWTSEMLAADNDGDFNTTWSLLTKKGGIHDSTNSAQRALVDVFNTQAKYNGGANGWFNKALTTYRDKATKYSFTNTSFERYVSDVLGSELGFADPLTAMANYDLEHANKLRNPARVNQAIRVGVAKGAIGYISNPNVVLRDVAFSRFAKTGDINNLSAILGMTTQTEQKLISIKKLTAVSGADTILAQRYSNSLNKIGAVNRKGFESGLKELESILYDSGTYARNKDEAIVNRSMSAIRSLFSDEATIKRWNDPLRSKMGGTAGNIIETVDDILSNLSKYGDSELTGAKAKELSKLKDIDSIKMGDAVLESYRGSSASPILMKRAGGDSGVPVGLYRYAGQGVGKKSGQKYIELHDHILGNKLVRSNIKRHRIYGESFSAIQAVLNNEFESTTADITDSLISSESARIQQSAMGSAYDFEVQRVAAQHMSDPNRTMATLDDLINKSLLDATNPSVRDHIANITGNPISEGAYRLANDQFFNNKELGVPMRRFAVVTHALAKDNYISNENELITAFNNHIRNRGLSQATKLSEGEIAHIHNKVLQTSLRTIPNLAADQVDNIISTYGSRADAMIGGNGIKLQPSRLGDIDGIINSITSTPLYNMDSFKSTLVTRANDLMSAVSSQDAVDIGKMYMSAPPGQTIEQLSSSPEGLKLLEDYGRSKIKAAIDRDYISKPFTQMGMTESAKIQGLSSQYSAIASQAALGSKEASAFLGWQPVQGIDEAMKLSPSPTYSIGEVPGQSMPISRQRFDYKPVINALAESKVSYGRYVGMQFNQLDIGQLRTVMSMQPTQGMASFEVGNIINLKQRVGQYMSLLDISGTDHVMAPAASIPRVNVIGSNIGEVLSANNIEVQSYDNILAGLKRELKPNLIYGTIGEEALRGIPHGGINHTGKFGKAAVAGIALGLAGLVVGYATASPGPLMPNKKNTGKGEAPAVDGSYNQTTVAYTGPNVNMPKSVPVIDNQNGIKFSVKGKNKGQYSNQDVANTVTDTISKSMPRKMNVNVTSRDDTSSVNDSWLTEQFKRLLN